MIKESDVMKTRMQKYYNEENTETKLRQTRNENLYENISNYELNDYTLETNVTVLDNNAKNIDVEQIKKILDNKYNQLPKRRSIILKEEEEEEPIISLDETREYDINAILERARSEKEVDYDSERLKKLRDTQYDILNSLEIENEEEIKEDNNELMDLINTITARELISNNKNKKSEIVKEDSKEELNPLDILVDLKGSEDTIVVSGVDDNIEEESINETSPIMSLKEAEAIKPQVEELAKEKNVDLSNTLTFTQSDFDDFNDLKKEVKSSKALIYAVTILVGIIILVGVFIFVNKFLNLSLF